jgi:hypothetical protein
MVFVFRPVYGIDSLLSTLESQMIVSVGDMWIKLDHTHERLVAMAELLNKTERYIISIEPRVWSCDYWALCRDNPEENISVRLEEGLDGKQLHVTWEDACENVVGFDEFFSRYNLHPYIGRNKAGNWGIHRHIHDLNSQWNICILGSGNDGGTIGFHRTDDESKYEQMDDLHIYDVLEDNHHDELIASVPIQNGEIYSLHTLHWHSHRVPASDNRTEAFLLHPMNASTQQEAKKFFEDWA